MCVYKENGYKNCKEYLMELAENFGIDPHTVFEIASVLGENEDFDGLVTTLEDHVNGY